MDDSLLVEVLAALPLLGVGLWRGRGRGGLGGLPAAAGDASGRIEADLEGGSGGEASTPEVKTTN